MALQPSIQKLGIQLVTGKIGLESWSVGSKIKQPDTLGISLTSGVVTGTRMLFDNTDGCPDGWIMVSGSDGYHLRLTTNADGDVGDTNADPSTAHTHEGVDECGNVNDCEGTGYGLCDDGVTSSTSPAWVPPAIEYLLCEKN